MTTAHRCSVAGCHHVVRRITFCNKHLQRWLKYGDTSATKRAVFVPKFRGRPQS